MLESYFIHIPYPYHASRLHSGESQAISQALRSSMLDSSHVLQSFGNVEEMLLPLQVTIAHEKDIE